jgi:hypothetical protein
MDSPGSSRTVIAMRIVALLLAIVVMVGTATELRGSDAMADVAGAVAGDDAPDVVVPSLAEPVALARPDHRPIASIEAPAEPAGRSHAVLIFRPPR